MAAGHVQLAPDGSGKDVDADSLVSTESGTPIVYRQNVVIADPTTYAAKASVLNTTPAGTEYGQAVRVVANPRTLVALTATGVVSVTSEALITLTQEIGVGVATTTGTSYTVPTGKTLRVITVPSPSTTRSAPPGNRSSTASSVAVGSTSTTKGI